VCVLWVRGYWVIEERWLGWGRPSGQGTSSGYVLNVQNWRGRMWISLEVVTDADPRWWQKMHHVDGTRAFAGSFTFGPGDQRTVSRLPAFGFARRKFAPSSRYQSDEHANRWAEQDVRAPHWSFFLVTALLPAVWAALAVSRGVRNRRSDARLCTSCGYDLRATPERCPECGNAAAPAKGLGISPGERKRPII
jgi:hypothetical protein